MTEYQAWGPLDGPACLLTTAEGIRNLMGQASWDPEHVHLFSIRATSWEDAMCEYHRVQGWEPYQPFDGGSR